MNRQLYDNGGPVDQARDFYTNNLGMSEEEADSVLSNAMASLNERTQPQSMMQMASNGGRIGFSEGGLTEYELLKLKELGYNVRKEGTETFGGVSVLKDILKTNKMAGGGIARLGYQMGGISSMPMDFGQPLQVPQQTSMPMQPMMSSPMANYGQTPLMMRGGGIARLGYEMGGVTLPSQGSEMSQMEGMDQEKSLQTIIQILIENGVPAEKAKELALQLLQVFIQGGEPALEAFANQLEQEEQAQGMSQEMSQGQGIEQLQGMQEEPMMMAGGGIAGYGYRQGYGFGGIGKIFKGAAKAVSGVVKGVSSAVKKVVKSDIGKLALTAAAIYATGGGSFFGYTPFAGATPGFALSNLPGGSFLVGSSAGDAAAMGTRGIIGQGGLFDLSAGSIANSLTSPSNLIRSGFNAITGQGGDGKGSGFVSNVLTGVGLTKIADMFSGPKRDDETDDQYQQRLKSAPGYLRDYYSNLNPDATSEQVEDFVQKNTVEYRALGGRIGYKEAGMVEEDEDLEEENNEVKEEGIMKIASNTNPLADRDDLARDLFGKPYIELTPLQQEQLNNYIEEKTSKKSMGTKFAAMGGSMVPPARRIEGGVIELDARKSGGYIPYGKKERVDDVPAMLAKDEFVFTSRAVKGAGDGSARRGAAKMYKLMKQLETKGMKMERGARA